jgi:hypothetical protein
MPKNRVLNHKGRSMSSSYTSSISPDKLSRLIGTAAAPALIDVRTDSYIETLRDNKALAGALSAITAAVQGVILALSIWFDLHGVPANLFSSGIRVVVRRAGADRHRRAGSPSFARSGYRGLRFNIGMLVVLAASCITGVLLRLMGII